MIRIYVDGVMDPSALFDRCCLTGNDAERAMLHWIDTEHFKDVFGRNLPIDCLSSGCNPHTPILYRKRVFSDVDELARYMVEEGA